MTEQQHRIYCFVLLCYFLCTFGLFVYQKFNEDSILKNDNNWNERKLLSVANCTKRSVEEFPEDFMTRKEREKGGVTFHILLSIYLFITLTIVCDEYFVPSLERICEVLNLSHDVAGATFMAVGGSAPELCTAVIGVFVTSSDVGVSTIVGSAVFNVLCVTAICGLFAGKTIYLTWWPVLRDCVIYCITIISLITVMNDGLIHWYEGLVMVLIYVMYVILLCYNDKVRNAIFKLFSKSNEIDKSEYTSLIPQDDEIAALPDGFVEKEFVESQDIELVNEKVKTNEEESTEDEQMVSICDIPNVFWKRILWIITLPIRILCLISIPDCRRPGIWRKCFFFTFIMSLFWIALSTYLLVWMICITGDTLGIPDTIMGLTMLAAGASIPDAISGFLVAREGHGDMAICTSIGSNTIDILIGLGLPWLIQTGMINAGSSIQIASSGLTYTSITLLATVVILLICIMINKWKLNKLLGAIYLVVYLAVITFSCLYELNVFGEFSLRPCPRRRL